jgi:hypothetical protein
MIHYQPRTVLIAPFGHFVPSFARTTLMRLFPKPFVTCAIGHVKHVSESVVMFGAAAISSSDSRLGALWTEMSLSVGI